jgi:WD40 repeat protein
MQKQAVIDQIQNFGQTPAQLLIAPHPPRDPPSPNTMFYSLAQPIPPSVFEGTLSMTLQLPFSTGYSLIAYKDSVIAVNRNGEYLMNKWTWKTPKELKAESSGDLRGLSGPQINLPFEIDLDHDYSTSSAISFTPLTNSQNDWKQKLKFIERIQNSITSGHENKRIPTVTMPSHDAPEHLSSAPFLLLDEDPYMVITYGYWDNSFKVTKIGEFDTSKMTRVLQSIVAHKRPVTVCDAAGSYLVTGSVDATLRVFKIDHRRREKREGFYVKDEYEHVLYGHYDPITAVKLHSDLDIAVSSSSRGVCLVHTLTKGRLIRALSLPADRDSTIDLIQISREGLIVLYSSACRTLWLFSLNGQLLAQRSQDEDIDVTEHGRYVISTMLLTKNGKFLITAGDKHVTVWSMHDLSIVHRYDPVSENVVAINFAHDERALLVALQNGQLTIIYKPNIGSQLIPGNV